jgi:cell division topological specificity factor
MGFLDYFRATRRKRGHSAQQAKERLQMIIVREGPRHQAPDFLPRLKRELIEVVRKYVTIDQEKIKVQLDREGDYEVLDLTITLEPDENPD